MEENVQYRGGSVHVKRLLGLVLIGISAVLIAKKAGYPFPDWLFSWEIIVIIIGLILGIKKRFSDLSWLIFMLVGGIFLIDDIWPEISLKQFIVPIVLSVVGLLFLFSPKMSKNHQFNRCVRPRRQGEGADAYGANFVQPGEAVDDNFLDLTAVFGSVKKNILSKNFSGADITCVFGGCELNLINADFTPPLLLDCTQVFGGMKLIVPADWEIRADATTIFGSIEDKRPPIGNVKPEKTIIIDGTMFFGGIEIKSF